MQLWELESDIYSVRFGLAHHHLPRLKDFHVCCLWRSARSYTSIAIGHIWLTTTDTNGCVALCTFRFALDIGTSPRQEVILISRPYRKSFSLSLLLLFISEISHPEACRRLRHRPEIRMTGELIEAWVKPETDVTRKSVLMTRSRSSSSKRNKHQNVRRI